MPYDYKILKNLKTFKQKQNADETKWLSCEVSDQIPSSESTWR